MESESLPVQFKPINIREVFYGKNPGFARMIPGFAYRFIHHIMRLDFINGFITRYGNLTGMDFVNASVKDFGVTEEIIGGENIPSSGSYIFAGNHPLGGFDSLLLMENVYKRLGRFKFIVNDVLMNIPPLKPIFLPVNHHGSNSREVARVMKETFESGEQILIFPSGLASRKIKGEIKDLKWQKHFITKAIEYKRDVIPVFISGKNSNRFYLVAKFRTLFKISWNLEMFLLPDETYRHREKKIKLYFGKPISYKTFDKSRTHLEWADFVKEKVYELPGIMDVVNNK
jgi:1-acyl-sn-glycerol-3-phosphate acyltransferase